MCKRVNLLLQQDFGNAIAVDVIHPHFLLWENLHPIRKRHALDEIDSELELKTAVLLVLFIEIQIGVRQAIFGSRKQASVDELVFCQGPRIEHPLKVGPVKAVPCKIK